MSEQTGTVADYSDAQLLERAVYGARPCTGKRIRWACVADRFALGSTYAGQLCKRFKLNPDDYIDRNGKVKP